MAGRDIDVHAEYEKVVIEGGNRAMVPMSTKNIAGYLNDPDQRKLTEGVSRKIRDYGRYTHGRPSVLSIVTGRLFEQGTYDWTGLLGEVYFDAFFMPKKPIHSQSIERIGLTVFSVMEEGCVHPQGFQTEIAYLAPNSATTVHDVLPRGTDIPRELAFATYSAALWRLVA